jgi:hypothetical protein
LGLHRLFVSTKVNLPTVDSMRTRNYQSVHLIDITKLEETDTMGVQIEISDYLPHVHLNEKKSCRGTGNIEPQ